ncbi:unnamed protein product [Effrenium voratum]|nr:unnamed protein product [Effrenium voratum]
MDFLLGDGYIFIFSPAEGSAALVDNELTAVSASTSGSDGAIYVPVGAMDQGETRELKLYFAAAGAAQLPLLQQRSAALAPGRCERTTRIACRGSQPCGIRHGGENVEVREGCDPLKISYEHGNNLLWIKHTLLDANTCQCLVWDQAARRPSRETMSS